MLHFPERLYPSSLRLGAILAGGQSRRFGSPKQLAEVGGTRLVERVASVVRAAGARPVFITAPEVPDLSHVLPCRADTLPGHGPLGGLHTAIEWARELGLTGTLCLACDMPFVAPALLRHIAEVGEGAPGFIVAPESGGPHGIEPLCAWYPVTAAREIESRLGDSRRSIGELLEVLPLRRIPLAEVEAHGDPATIFLNINTPADRARAAAIDILREDGDGVG